MSDISILFNTMAAVFGVMGITVLWAFEAKARVVALRLLTSTRKKNGTRP